MDIISKADEVLLKINSLNENPGEFIKKETISHSFRIQGMEDKLIDYLINDVLEKKFSFLVSNKTSNKYKITPDGFIHLHDLLFKSINTRKVFCALWFDNSLNRPWIDAIKPAIIACNYIPVRIDEEHFNEDINAQIIMNINSSKFIIADFTGNRGGVYFEAGLAQGQKKPVIFTCEKEFFNENKPHFDVEHYSFILWNQHDLEDFKNKLIKRITITIPQDFN